MKGSSSRGLVGVQRGTEVSDARKGAATTLVFKVRNRMSSGARPRPGLFSSTAILSWRLSKIIGRPTNGTIGGVDIDKWGWLGLACGGRHSGCQGVAGLWNQEEPRGCTGAVVRDHVLMVAGCAWRGAPGTAQLKND